MITKTERMRLEEVFSDGDQVPEKREHWIHGADEGESYCSDCAEKKVAELLAEKPDGEYCVDGGWGTDGDGTAYCETCGHRLDNALTQSGCEDEVEHFLGHGWTYCPWECLDMHRVISSGMWEPFAGQTDPDEDYFRGLYRLCRRILDNNFWIMPDNDYRHMWE